MDNELIEELALAMATKIAERHGHDPDSWLNDQRREEAGVCVPTIERLLADAREAGARAMQEALYSNLRSDPHTGAILFPPIDPTQFREVKS